MVCEIAMRTSSAFATVVALAMMSPAGDAAAHGFAGQRFFPATILTDDPFVADEMSLPTITLYPWMYIPAGGHQWVGYRVFAPWGFSQVTSL